MPPNINHDGNLHLPEDSVPPSSAETAVSSPATISTGEEKVISTFANESVDGLAPEKWSCPASQKSFRTLNPIRAIVDRILSDSDVVGGKKREDEKEFISLALGDPTTNTSISPCPPIPQAIQETLQLPGNPLPSYISTSYVNACGSISARKAIASHHSAKSPPPDETSFHKDDKIQDDSWSVHVDPDDVIVANGCSGALELALTALLDEGTYLLVPRPGFPLYQVIAESHGANVLQYDLLADQKWQCDLKNMEQIILEAEYVSQGQDHTKTDIFSETKRVIRGIVINNPSNPTGSVYSEEHLQDIVSLAEKYRIPIIADEVYGDWTFRENRFVPLANVAAKMGTQVPVITASGLGKQFFIPGWRIGWIVFHDCECGALQEVKAGASRLAQVVLGASHLAQVVVPSVLGDQRSVSNQETVKQWKDQVRSILCRQGMEAYQAIQSEDCPGLHPVGMPQGAMYLMVKINAHEMDDSISDDVSFTRLLLEEENVLVLPGKAFGMTAMTTDQAYYIRIAFCSTGSVMLAAIARMGSFCKRHHSSQKTSTNKMEDVHD